MQLRTPSRTSDDSSNAGGLKTHVPAHAVLLSSIVTVSPSQNSVGAQEFCGMCVQQGRKRRHLRQLSTHATARPAGRAALQGWLHLFVHTSSCSPNMCLMRDACTRAYRTSLYIQ